MVIYAATNNYLTDIPVEEIKTFEKDFIDYMRTQNPEIGKSIAETGKLSSETEERLKDAIDKFKKIR